jgi:hypothetical protein
MKDIVDELEACAAAAANNVVWLTPTFRVENWPHETLRAAAEEIRRLRAQRVMAKPPEPSRIDSISDALKRMNR